MPVGTDVCLGPGDIVLDGNPVPPISGTADHPQFSAGVYFAKTTAEYLSYSLTSDTFLARQHQI